MIFSHVLYQLSYLGAVPVGAQAYRRNAENCPAPLRAVQAHSGRRFFGARNHATTLAAVRAAASAVSASHCRPPLRVASRWEGVPRTYCSCCRSGPTALPYPYPYPYPSYSSSSLGASVGVSLVGMR